MKVFKWLLLVIVVIAIVSEIAIGGYYAAITPYNMTMQVPTWAVNTMMIDTAFGVFGIFLLVTIWD